METRKQPFVDDVMNKESEMMDKVRDYAKANLAECCTELVVWKSTSLLKDGHIRKMAAMIAKADIRYGLAISETIVHDLALAFTATNA